MQVKSSKMTRIGMTPFQEKAALKAAREVRYWYQANNMVERKVTTKEENKLVAGLERTDKKMLAQMNEKEPASGSCTVKVEYPQSVDSSDKKALAAFSNKEASGSSCAVKVEFPLAASLRKWLWEGFG